MTPPLRSNQQVPTWPKNVGKQLAPQYKEPEEPPSVLLLNEVASAIFSCLPIPNSFSCVNKQLNKLFKDVFFFPLLLRMLPEVKQQIKEGVLLAQISETMKIRNNLELAPYLAKKMLNPNTTENKKGSVEDLSMEDLSMEDLSRLKTLATKGSPTAQYELGKVIYNNGNSPPKDCEMALRWLYLAAPKSSNACGLIGLMLLKGHGDSQNFEKATEWLEKAIALDSANTPSYIYLELIRSRNGIFLEELAKKGSPTAQYELGKFIYNDGDGNHIKALEWLYLAAPKSSNACGLIGLMLSKGHGDSQNFKKATEWLEKAIALDSANTTAYVDLGLIRFCNQTVVDYCTADTFGDLLDQEDRTEAMRLFLTAAELGSTNALHCLGTIHMNNGFKVDPYEGVEILSHEDVELAMEYLQRVSNGRKGMVPRKLTDLSRYVFRKHDRDGLVFSGGVSEFLLGMLYLHGWYVRQKVLKGINYLITAAEKGHKNAPSKLSDWYIQAKKSEDETQLNASYFSTTEKLFKDTVCSLERVAKDGHPEAFYALGTMYEVDPTDSSQKKANHYFEQAVIHNKHKKAAEKVGPAMLLRASEHLTKEEYLSAYAIYAPLAETESAEAKNRIAFMYMGKLIHKIDKKLFVICLEHLVNQGVMQAAVELANWHMETPHNPNAI